MGTVAAITAAGSGIGRAIAVKLASRRFRLAINDLDGDKLEAVTTEASEAGGQFVSVCGDAAELPVIEALVNTCMSRFGSLDVAVANCGVTRFEPFMDCSFAVLDHLLRTNVSSAFFLAQRAARVMRGRGGCILLMSSVLARQPYPGLAAYGMTKAALSHLAATLALELAPQRIRVNALAPGATLTDRTIRDDPHYAEHWSRITPGGRAASVEDIANAAAFMASEDARHINGQTLVIDGGWSADNRFPPA